ncbi:hypothetical protein BCR34DRAFT_119225 [Clohesyomyces aquaticus]|uniref:Uncharacterized protein n=1 Tax=Clohesyomyces aquaticus TaxID=1231657 RepID=A0A1Y2A177_9PLEO|nr:hypothetical protein BCR34DRAFT_119225 [Clohesyomyces aquaticus]
MKLSIENGVRLDPDSRSSKPDEPLFGACLQSNDFDASGHHGRGGRQRRHFAGAIQFLRWPGASTRLEATKLQGELVGLGGLMVRQALALLELLTERGLVARVRPDPIVLSQILRTFLESSRFLHREADKCKGNCEKTKTRATLAKPMSS